MALWSSLSWSLRVALLLVVNVASTTGFVPSSVARPFMTKTSSSSLQDVKAKNKEALVETGQSAAKLKLPWQSETGVSSKTTTRTTTSPNTQGMEDLTRFLPNETKDEPSAIQEVATRTTDSSPSASSLIIPGALAVCTAIAAVVANNAGYDLTTIVQNPQGLVQDVIDQVQAMGPLGPLYYGAFYVLCETLALPATPLTLSAGYLFGMTQGVIVVLLAGTIAASIGFAIGKTVLRSWVEETVLEQNPTFKKLDRAIGKEGFKLLVLIRLTPIFPFSIANYVYGASSIDFPSYFLGTLIGFTPGSVAYVYTGMVGKELMLGEGDKPWFFYVVGLAVLAGMLKLITDVAANIVNAIEEEE